MVANLSGSRFPDPVKAVAFDLDDTLFDRRAALSVLLEKWTGLKPDPDLISWMNLAGHERFLIQLNIASEGSVDPREVSRRFRAEFPGCVTPDPQALSVLERLVAAGVPLGLLSNGAPGMQLAKLRACGADRYFPLRWRLFSGCTGFQKPEPQAFRMLARRMGLDPGEILFVGDDPLRDIAGATDAGMMTCQLVRPGRERVAGVPTIGSLAELPDLISL